jgi:beta-galactosidase
MLYFGSDYYPEHWPEDRWAIDLAMMKQARFNMVRVAEFAWSRLEPLDGSYDFAWLDRFVELCTREGLLVMMGVPVRNVPPWLLALAPDMAIKAYEGHREVLGGRYTTCLNHPLLRERALEFSRRMAERYGHNGTVAVWHLDNEYGDASQCFCEYCRREFVAWLQGRYTSLEELNRRWGLVFWSLELTDWSELPLPARSNHFPHNPSLLQEFCRFTSWSTERFVAEQAQLFRDHTRGQLVTTNLQSMTRYHTDYYRLGESLDVVSTNFYPPVSYNTLDLDVMRGIKERGFWVVEQKSGTPEQKCRTGGRVHTHNGFYSPEPGETRLYTYQSLARGAEAVLYFRWRPSFFGQEQLHGGILNHDGTTNRIYEEITRTGEEIERLAPKLEGTSVRSDVAMLLSYDARWALDYFYPHPDLGFRDFFLRFHGELESQHFAVDIVAPQRDLTAYRIVIVPLLYLMDEETVKNLRRYVEGGGTLFYTFRSGAKDRDSNLVPTIIPEGLSEVLGVEVEEAMAMAPESPTSLVMLDGSKHTASLWLDLLRPKGAQVLGRYEAGWYRGRPAMTENAFGRGRAYYLGTLPDATFFRSVLGDIVRQAGAEPILEAPREVHVCRRSGDDREILFFLNGSREERLVSLPWEAVDLLADSDAERELRLEPWGVKVLLLR